MSDDEVDCVAAILAVQACLQAACAAAAADGRRSKRQRTNQFTVRTNVWQCVETSTIDGWYRNNLRITRDTFDKTVNLLESHAAESGSKPPAENSYVDFRKQVAIALHYLSQESGFIATASLFGIAKSSAIRCVNSVLDLLVDIAPKLIR
jgi:hypothetical protein